MTITAIETDRRRRRRDRRLLLRRAADDNRRLTQNDPPPPPSHPSIEEKEEIAIVEHLTRVYDEVLSIAPVSVSLAFEEDLVVDEMGNDGVIRKSAFRVMGEREIPSRAFVPTFCHGGVISSLATLSLFRTRKYLIRR
jgi:hypothetical protein